MIIPLARIVPRLLKRGSLNENISARPESPRGNFFQESSSSDNFQESSRREEFSTKNWSKEKIVLGLLMTNISKFEEIQKKGNLSTNNLDTILQDLEKRGLMKPVEKTGPFGKSIQLKITEKGVAEFRRM
jgi:predicted transcriptional regulator